MRLFGTSGIRRVADREFLELAFRVGLAIGKLYPNVVIGSDARMSADAVKYSVISGLLAAGADCSDASIVPTPTLALATSEFQAGVMITASHNPPEYNGIKLWNTDGSAFSPAQQQELEELVFSSILNSAEWRYFKQLTMYPLAIEKHIAKIMADFPYKLNVKVVVDSGGGAASIITPSLLKGMGCEVIELNCRYDGTFPRPSEPTEKNLQGLIDMVKNTGAALGIAHDGDAERMMAVDDNGEFIVGDKLMAILAKAVGATSVVTTVDASMVIEKMGYAVTRTRVGDAAVSDELKQNNADFGGEPSGSWIFPMHSLCPDGIYAAALMVKLASEQKLSKLIKTIPEFPIRRGSVPCDAAKFTDLENRLSALGAESIDMLDGFRLNYANGWVLVRPSGTEPKMRITAEAKNMANLDRIYGKVFTMIQDMVIEREDAA